MRVDCQKNFWLRSDWLRNRGSSDLQQGGENVCSYISLANVCLAPLSSSPRCETKETAPRYEVGQEAEVFETTFTEREETEFAVPLGLVIGCL